MSKRDDGPGADAIEAQENADFTIVVARRQRDGVEQFLLVHNPERGWELPGGKVEAREGPVRCALREFREETGHLLADPKFVLKRAHGDRTCYVFTGRLGAEATSNAQRAGEEPETEVIDAMEWFDTLPDDLAFPDDPYEPIGDALGIRFR